MTIQLIEFSLENGKSIFVEEKSSIGRIDGESEASRIGDYFKKKLRQPFKKQ